MAYKRDGSILPIKGLDTSKPAEYITEQNSPNCQNFDIDHSVLKKRVGLDELEAMISGVTTDIMAGQELKLIDSSFAVRIGVDKAQLWNGTTEQWDTLTASGSTITASVDDEISICNTTLSGSNIMVWTCGSYNPQKFLGGSVYADLAGSPPKAKYCENFGAYLLIAHITDDAGSTYRNRVQWADTGKPQIWTGGSSGYKDLLDGRYYISGLKRFGNYITVHKQDMVFIGYLVSSSSVIKFDSRTTPGAICNATIQVLPNGFMIYYSIDGLRLFNGSYSTLVDSKINENLKEEVNYNEISKAWSLIIQEKNEYWIGLPIQGEDYARVVYRYNYLTNNFYKNDYGRNIRSAFLFSNANNITWDNYVGTWEGDSNKWNITESSAAFPIPTIHTDTGHSYMITNVTNNDDGDAIDAIFETKDYKPEIEGQLARWLQIELWAKGTEVSVYYSTDKGETWYLIEEKTLDSNYPTDDSPLMLYFDVVSSQIRFKFQNDSLNASLFIKQFIISYSPRELRGY